MLGENGLGEKTNIFQYKVGQSFKSEDLVCCRLFVILNCDIENYYVERKPLLCIACLSDNDVVSEI